MLWFSLALSLALSHDAFSEESGLAPVPMPSVQPAPEPAAPLATPKISAPLFPLEPDKKMPRPLDEKSLILGPSTPPVEKEISIPRKGRAKTQAWGTFDVGWFYANQNADHAFSSSVISSAQTVNRANSDALSLFLRYEILPEFVPISLILQGQLTTGTATATGFSAGPIGTKFSVQDYRGSLGLRLHPFGRRLKSDFKIGADFGPRSESFTTLTSTQNAIDVDQRQLWVLVPKLAYLHAWQNWSVEFSLGYEMLASSKSGSGDAQASNFKGYVGELTFIRYLSPGTALGFGAIFESEKMTWNQSTPVSLSDNLNAQDLRLLVYLHKEF